MNQIFYFQKENLYIEFISSTITISCVIIIMYLSFCVIPHRESGPFFQSTRKFKFGNNCCYNRLLDDRSYSHIYYERNSVMLILELAEHSAIQLIGNQMPTDKKFLNNCQRITTYTKVMNPNEWLLEVLY